MHKEDEKKDLIKLGQLVRKTRSEKGFSQEGFADYIAVHRTYMGSIERGENNIGFLNLIKIARALNLDLNSLL